MSSFLFLLWTLFICHFPPQFINTMNTGWRQIRTNERKLPSCLGSETTGMRWVTKSQPRIIQNRWGGKHAKAAWWPPKQPYSFPGQLRHTAPCCRLWPMPPASWVPRSPQNTEMRINAMLSWRICVLYAYDLYAGQEAIVRIGHGTTDWFHIGKGVLKAA